MQPVWLGGTIIDYYTIIDCKNVLKKSESFIRDDDDNKH